MGTPGSRKIPWRLPVAILGLLLLILGGNLAVSTLTEVFSLEIRPANEEMIHRLLMVAAAVYALLIAIPFVPGVELGLAIISLLGPPIVFLIYISTLAGLSLSFAVGRLIPLRVLVTLFDRLGLARASRLLTETDGRQSKSLQDLLLSRTHNRFLRFLLAYRYLALIIAINLPGNFLLGGGGGIAMIAGTSRMFSPLGFIATVAIAVAPLPLAIAIFGDRAIDALRG